jgi:hypothetical protein
MLLNEWVKTNRVTVVPPGVRDENAQNYYQTGGWRNYPKKRGDEEAE